MYITLVLHCQGAVELYAGGIRLSCLPEGLVSVLLDNVHDAKAAHLYMSVEHAENRHRASPASN